MYVFAQLLVVRKHYFTCSHTAHPKENQTQTDDKTQIYTKIHTNYLWICGST